RETFRADSIRCAFVREARLGSTRFGGPLAPARSTNTPELPVTSLIGIRSPCAETGMVVSRRATRTRLAARNFAKVVFVFIFFLKISSKAVSANRCEPAGSMRQLPFDVYRCGNLPKCGEIGTNECALIFTPKAPKINSFALFACFQPRPSTQRA